MSKALGPSSAEQNHPNCRLRSLPSTRLCEGRCSSPILFHRLGKVSLGPQWNAQYCAITWYWTVVKVSNLCTCKNHQKSMRLPWSIFTYVSIWRIGWRCKLEFGHVLRFGSFTHTLVSSFAVICSFAHICPFISQKWYCCMVLLEWQEKWWSTIKVKQVQSRLTKQ